MLEAHLSRIASTNPKINAIVTLSEDIARSQATDVDKAVAAGEPLGPIAGVPVGIKDTTDTAGIRTTYGSPLFADNVPKRDDIMVSRLKQAGAVIIGKTNNPEFATGGNTFNDVFGATLNPWDTNLSAGGSTGGGGWPSVWNVPLASGSDLAGSLRTPAAFCVMGLRPTVGLVPPGRATFPLMLWVFPVPWPGQRKIWPCSWKSSVSHTVAIHSRTRAGSKHRRATRPDISELPLSRMCAVLMSRRHRKSMPRRRSNTSKRRHIVEVDLDFRDGRSSFLTLRAQWMVTKNLNLLDHTNLAGNIRAGLDQADRYRSRRSHSQPALEAIS